MVQSEDIKVQHHSSLFAHTIYFTVISAFQQMLLLEWKGLKKLYTYLI